MRKFPKHWVEENFEKNNSNMEARGEKMEDAIFLSNIYNPYRIQATLTIRYATFVCLANGVRGGWYICFLQPQIQTSCCLGWVNWNVSVAGFPIKI